MWMGVKLVRLIASITSLLKSAFFSATMACVIVLFRKSGGAINWKNMKCSIETIRAAKKYSMMPNRPPCMEKTDASSYVLPVTLGQVIGDERNDKT